MHALEGHINVLQFSYLLTGKGIETSEFEVGGFMEATTQPVKAHCHYTRDLCEHVLYQHNILGKTTTDIARDLDISLHVVQRTLQVWKEISDVLRDPKDYRKRG